MANYNYNPHYRSQFGDTSFTKVFVGGLAWETPTQELRSYFEQFGDILEAVIITDKNTAKSKGYGFVTFRDPESATRACADPNPVIDGRRANCNIASLGRPRPSPPRVRPQGGDVYVQRSAASASYGGMAAPFPPPPPPPPPPPHLPPVIYPQYGYPLYTPDYGYHQQAIYNSQVQQYHHVYGTTSSSSPYYYGYTLQSPSGPRGGAMAAPPPPPPPPQAAQRIPGPPSYVYYPSTSYAESSFSTFPSPRLHTPTRQHFSSTDSQMSQQTCAEAEAGVVTTPETPNSS